MSQSAYIKLVEGSTTSSLSLDEVKELLLGYKDQMSKTAQQLDWEYDDAAFPYTIETKSDSEGKWFYLKGTNKLYKHILFAVGSEKDEDVEKHYIHIVLPDDSTHGDKAKGNELSKYMGTKLKAELHLFNGRVMYYNPRK